MSFISISHHTYILLKVPLIDHDYEMKMSSDTSMCLVRINGGEEHWREMLANPSKVATRSLFFSSLSSHYWGQITATSSFQVAGGRGNRKTMKDRVGENINYLVYYQFHGSIATKYFKGGIKTPSLIS